MGHVHTVRTSQKLPPRAFLCAGERRNFTVASFLFLSVQGGTQQRKPQDNAMTKHYPRQQFLPYQRQNLPPWIFLCAQPRGGTIRRTASNTHMDANLPKQAWGISLRPYRRYPASVLVPRISSCTSRQFLHPASVLALASVLVLASVPVLRMGGPLNCRNAWTCEAAHPCGPP